MITLRQKAGPSVAFFKPISITAATCAPINQYDNGKVSLQANEVCKSRAWSVSLEPRNVMAFSLGRVLHYRNGIVEYLGGIDFLQAEVKRMLKDLALRCSFEEHVNIPVT